MTTPLFANTPLLAEVSEDNVDLFLTLVGRVECTLSKTVDRRSRKETVGRLVEFARDVRGVIQRRDFFRRELEACTKKAESLTQELNVAYAEIERLKNEVEECEGCSQSKAEEA